MKYDYNYKQKNDQSLNALDKNSFADLFKLNNFKDVFQKASFIVQMSKNRDESLEPFFKLVTEASLKRISNSNRMIDFITELNSFLSSRMFNEHEKHAFLNESQHICLIYALNSKNFECAENINNIRKKKAIKFVFSYVSEKMAEENYIILDKLFSLSDFITVNNSAILRMFYFQGARDYEKIKQFIEKFQLDINGLGTVPGRTNKETFAQSVASKEGTKANIFFEKFIKDFGNKIDYNIQANNPYNKKELNFFENLIVSGLPTPTILDRLSIVLENCELSEKHIGFISQFFLNSNNNILVKHYDHPVLKSLFSHCKFNSGLYDREAFLNKLMALDNTQSFAKARQDSNFTVNPISVILDNFSKHATPALPMEKHPFIGWINEQNENYSRDTFNSLMIFYKEEINTMDLSKAVIHSSLAKALSDFGVVCPEKSGFFSFWKTKSKNKKIVAEKQIPTVEKEPAKPLVKDPFNTVLFEQVKDEQINKYIESIVLNSEQFSVLFNGNSVLEHEHYMANLLPKFLNKTVDNYLHFSTIDELEAKNNAIVQLKIINKKTFEVLNYVLENEKDQLVTKNAVHQKIINKY